MTVSLPHGKPLRSLLFSALSAACLASCVATADPSGQLDGKSDDLEETGRCIRYGDAIETGEVRDGAATEISGLAMSRQNPGVLWAHNDGDGKELELFALDRSGAMLREIQIRGVDLTDVEDIAIGPGPQTGVDYLYLADTGDNPNDRKEIQVLRLPEPLLDGPVDLDANDVEVLRFRYDDDDPHDAEALMVDPWDGTIFVITKHGPDERHTRVYKSRPVVSPLDLNVLDEVLRDEDASWLEGSAVAGDISPDGTRIALLFKDEATRTWTREPGESLAETLARPACMSPSAPGQQESLAFSMDGRGYYLIPEGENPAVSFVTERQTCAEYGTPARLGVVSSPALEEVSGLARSGRSSDTLWAVNDSGNGEGRNVLIALDTSGRHLSDVTLAGIENIDWEDLSAGPGPIPGKSYLYVADIGDNDAERGHIKVYRFLEPLPGGAPVTIDTLRFEYPSDKARDAESLMVDPINGDIFIVSRTRSGDSKTGVYRAPAPHVVDEKIALEKVLDEDDNPDLRHSIVGADISADGLRVALLRRDGVPMLYDRHPDGPAFEALHYRGCRAEGATGKQDAIALDGAGGYFQLGEGTSPTLFHGTPRR